MIGRPLYPYILVLWFLAFKSSECLVYFNAAVFAGCLALLGILMFILLRAFSFLPGIKWGPIFISFVTVVFLFIEQVTSFLRNGSLSYHLSFSYGYLALLIPLAALLSYLWARIIRSFNTYANLVANVFLLVFSFIEILGGYQVYKKELNLHKHVRAGGAYVGVPSKPTDIVWILMDEYAASPCLQKDFGFTDPLDTFLERNGYTILPDIRTRSSVTLYSVNSIFNMDDSIVPANYMYAHYYLDNSEWPDHLVSSGFSFTSFDFMGIGGVKCLQDLNVFPQSYPEQIFYDTFLDMGKNMLKYYRRDIDRYNIEVADTLDKVLGARSGSPRFIWAHFLIPHMPFFRDSKGNPLAHPQKDVGGERETSKGYVDYLVYGNNMLMKLIDRHPELKDKIVIISGDHGARFPFIHDGDEYIRPYAAVHLPDHFDTTGLERVRYIQQLPAFIGSAAYK